MEDSFSLDRLLKLRGNNNTFIYTNEKEYSYSDAFTYIDLYRDYIRDNYFTPSYAALLGNNSADMIFIIMALWSLKITPILINTRLTKPETKKLLEQTGCRQIIIDQKLLFIDREYNTITYPVIPEVSARYNEAKIVADNTAVIIFTSGSTGSPRGVELTFRTLKESSDLQNKYLLSGKGDKWLASLPFFHIGGFSILTRSLFGGASVIIPSSLKTDDLMHSISSYKPDYISLVGSQLKKLLDEDFSPGYNIKNILIGGGFTDEKIILEALKKGFRISKVYGSTETAAFIAAAGPDELKKYPAAAGYELVKGSIDILDDNHNPLPAGSEGEIALRDIPIMKGYLNDSAGTKSKFSSGYYLTNDIGYKNDEGYLFVQMRRSDLIISGGENIDPKEIEKIILEIDGINDVYVFGTPDEEWGQSAAAVISSQKEYRVEEIKELVKIKLAGYKIPKHIYFLKNIPRSDLGKIDLASLKKLIDIR